MLTSYYQLDHIIHFPKINSHSLMNYFDYFKRGIFSHSVELPLNLQQLSAEMFAAYDRWTGRLVAEIKREWKEKGFPKGEGSETVLSGVFQTTLPHTGPAL